MDSDAILAAQDGELLPLCSQAALDALSGPLDPWYTYNGITYHFFTAPGMGDPDPCLLFNPGTCFSGANPIQLAVSDAKTRVAASGEADRVTLFVQSGLYSGDVLVDTPIWMQGLPGATINGVINIQSSWVTVDGFTINGAIHSRLNPTSGSDPYGFQNIRISNNTIHPDPGETSRPDTPAGEQEGGGIGIYIGTRSEHFNQSGATRGDYLYYRSNGWLTGYNPLDYDPVALPNPYLAGKGLLDYAGLVISGNTITGGRGGILLQGLTGQSDAEVQVSGNTISGIVDRSLVWLDSVQHINISNNTLTGSPTGTGIYFSSLADGYYTAGSSNTTYNNQYINITCNRISGNNIGIHVLDASEDTDLSVDGLSIQNNTISGNTTGMEVYFRYNGYIDARGNYWGGGTPTPSGGANIIRFYAPATSYANPDYVQNTALGVYVNGGNGRVYFNPGVLTSDPCSDGTCTFTPLAPRVPVMATGAFSDSLNPGTTTFTVSVTNNGGPGFIGFQADGLPGVVNLGWYEEGETRSVSINLRDYTPSGMQLTLLKRVALDDLLWQDDGTHTLLLPEGGSGAGEEGEGGDDTAPPASFSGVGAPPPAWTALSCGACAADFTILSAGASQARYYGLCKFEADVAPLARDALPGTLPFGSLVAGLTTNLYFGDQVYSRIPQGGMLVISFALPAGANADDYALLHWNPSGGVWDEIPAAVLEDGVYLSSGSTYIGGISMMPARTPALGYLKVAGAEEALNSLALGLPQECMQREPCAFGYWRWDSDAGKWVEVRVTFDGSGNPVLDPANGSDQLVYLNLPNAFGETRMEAVVGYTGVFALVKR